MPQHIPDRLWRVRFVALGIGAVIVMAVVALPWYGMHGVEQESRTSTALTAYLGQLDHAARAVAGVGSVALREYEQERTPDARERLHEARAEARTTLTALERSAGGPHFPFSDAEARYLAAARAFLGLTEDREGWIAAGHTPAAYPRTRDYLGAQTETLQTHAEITRAVTGDAVAASAREADAITRARGFVIVSAAIALAGFAAFGWIEMRAGRRDLAATQARATYLEQVAESRADLVNLASHELRNPLTVMTLTAEALQRSAARRGDEQLASLAGSGVTAARRAEALVAELLDLSRLDADRLDLTLQPVPVHTAIEDALRLTAETRGARPVRVSGDAGLAVTADPGRFGIIVRNLVDNAFKYSPDGSPVTVTTSIRGNTAVVAVEDQGPGVRPGDAERVFSRFERLAPTKHIGGIGIGLHLSRELARRMGGDVQVRASESGGGCFELSLPLAAPPAGPRGSDARQPIQTSGTVTA
ncbi:MAG: HAMP domain-containing histidine kinase [Dehalococcoidia bacterium]|nr:HAMP domain-containing histidine kinase [Dehalococcoidia bacterium]